ncbi:unnamed protein product, partial [Symbiodinium pilosum]
GAGWTAAPGEAMAPSDWALYPHADGWWAIHVPASAIEFVMTDGHGAWAKDQNGENLLIRGSGTWTVCGHMITRVEDLSKEGSITYVEEEKQQVQVLQQPPEPAAITVLYQTGWTAPRLHYSAEGAGWTAAPGEAMAPSDWALYPPADGWWAIHAIEFVMTDGHGAWAKAGRRSAFTLLPAFLQ